MTKSLIASLVIIVALLLSAVGYFIFQNQKVLKELANQKQGQKDQVASASAQTQVTSSSPLPSPSPIMTSKQLKENIQAAVNSKNFAAISTYVTIPKVNFSLMSSECCQPQTPDEAAAQMEYIKDGVPMDFNQENPTIKNLKAKNPELADAYIGVSQAKEQLAAFKFDSQNKISWIQLAITYKLYTN